MSMNINNRILRLLRNMQSKIQGLLIVFYLYFLTQTSPPLQETAAVRSVMMDNIKASCLVKAILMKIKCMITRVKMNHMILIAVTNKMLINQGEKT